MSNETYVTVRGYVGSVPTIFGAEPQKSTVVIRVGVTARRFNREAEEYTNGETAWYSVRCFGTLGQHVARSVQRGTPVLVRGRLVPRLWVDKDGVQRTEFNILADAVGIELSTGVGHFIHARLTEAPALDGCLDRMQRMLPPRQRLRLELRAKPGLEIRVLLGLWPAPGDPASRQMGPTP